MTEPSFWAIQIATKEILVQGGRCFTSFKNAASAKTYEDALATKEALLKQGALDVDVLPSYFLPGGL